MIIISVFMLRIKKKAFTPLRCCAGCGHVRLRDLNAKFEKN